MPFVSQSRPLQPGEFYIPRLGRIDAAFRLPVVVSQFTEQFRILFDAEIYVSKRLDLNAFGGLGDFIHILARIQSTDAWTFERFAPACTACIGTDLTGSGVSDARLAPYHLRLDEKLAHLVREETPLYGRTRVNSACHKFTFHWLFVPMSNTGQIITHCLLMSVFKGGQHHDHGQGTADLGAYSQTVGH
jgi:hypothetical protein